ncbi:MAG TPA: hypothetical protein VMY88_01105 [Acidimicrobiales bacterium]|nr:hypothetical protein [Acidimicrobiales bacterium]
MGKASTNKKVARAAATGGGARTARGAGGGPWKWYVAIALAMVVGVALLVVSRSERLDKIKQVDPPRTTDHWHVAYGIHVCGAFQPGLTVETDPSGIHTHAPEGQGDGIIHIHPFTSNAAGKNATLGKFLDAAKLGLEDGKLTMPDGDVYEDGDKCGGKESVLRVKRDDKIFTEDLRDIRFTKDRGTLTIFFGPKDAEIPEPPSKENLDNLSDVAPGQQPPTQEIPPGDPTASTAPAVPLTDDQAPTQSTAPPEETTPTSGAGTTQAP